MDKKKITLLGKQYASYRYSIPYAWEKRQTALLFASCKFKTEAEGIEDAFPCDEDRRTREMEVLNILNLMALELLRGTRKISVSCARITLFDTFESKPITIKRTELAYTLILSFKENKLAGVTCTRRNLLSRDEEKIPFDKLPLLSDADIEEARKRKPRVELREAIKKITPAKKTAMNGKRPSILTFAQLERAIELGKIRRLHTAMAKGYIKRGKPEIRSYRGKFGEGVTVHENGSKSNSYHDITYYIYTE